MQKGKGANLLWSNAELKQHGIEAYWVDLGGDVTYPSPGQLVAYPLMPMSVSELMNPKQSSEEVIFQVDYMGYLRTLVQVLILA